MNKTLIHNLSRQELAEYCESRDIPSFRADQIWRWLYVRRVTEWDEMKNLPRDVRNALNSSFLLQPVAEAELREDARQTRKILVRLNDGQCVEEVLIPAAGRKTVCVSTQVGCKFACAFCASGQHGFNRNLETGEMIGQTLLACRAWTAQPTHVVFMGVGEPLDNYDNALKAIRILNDKEGFNIGARRITISTCGLVPGMERLEDEGLQIELSVSLHAPDDKLRSELMPVNRKHPIGRLLDACGRYSGKTGRIVTFEYAMIAGVNDSPGHALKLAALLGSVPGRVNLIPLSAVKEFSGRPSGDKAVREFVRILSNARVNATVRASRGSAVDAACGQLRSRMMP